jgi:nicotinamidase-related amidase
MYTLVVIDMQSVFRASANKDTLAHCKREIKQAMSKRAAIMYVEYGGYPKTLPQLTKLTEKYSRKFFVTKNSNGGGAEVKASILKHGLPKTRIKVCGVNTDFCVLETVAGLTEKLKSAKIQVLSKACNSTSNHTYGLERLKKLKRVRVKK